MDASFQRLASLDLSNLAGEHFRNRKLFADEKTCTEVKYQKCFSKCPPQIPGPPPPPHPSLKQFNQPWCKAHDSNWTCVDTNAGPNITGRNPRVEGPLVVGKDSSGSDDVVVIATVIPILALLILGLFVALFILRKRRQSARKKVDNTYNLGYLSKPAGPAWTDHDGNEGAVEDGSEIFYQVDRSALAAGMNGGGGRSIPDVVQHSASTLRRSGSAASNTPLITSPVLSAKSKRGNRHYSGGNTAGNYGNGAEGVDDGSQTGLGRPIGSGYSTYSPSHTNSHPALYSKRNSIEPTGVNTPKNPNKRNRSFGSTDISKPRPLRKQSASNNANIQRSDSMTLNRDRENYKSNWENFDEITATMKRNRPHNRELVLGTDSFIDSYTTPDDEEATTVDQLGLPTRNPFLTGFYDEDDFHTPSNDLDDTFGAAPIREEDHSAPTSPTTIPSTPSTKPQAPPDYEDVVQRIAAQRKNSRSASTSQEPDRRVQQLPDPSYTPARSSRINEYDSEASVEI